MPFAITRKKIQTLFFCFLFLAGFPFKVSAEDPTEKLFTKGLSYMEQKKDEKAEKIFKEISLTIFGHYPSLYNLGLIALKDKNYEKSLSYLNDAKQFNPYDMRIDKMIVIAHFMQGNYKTAKEYLTLIIKKTPADLSAHKLLGIIHLHNEDYSSAISEFSLCKNLAHKSAEENLLLSLAYCYNGEPEKALNKADYIKETLPTDLSLAYYGYLLEKNQKPVEAKSCFDKAGFLSEDSIPEQLLIAIEISTIGKSVDQIHAYDKFENSEITQKIISNLKLEGKNVTPQSQRKTMVTAPKKRPFNLSGTLTETFEFYDRDPTTSSPIDGINTTNNLKIQGKTSKDVNFSSEWEWFYNRWNHTDLDYYKVNVKKTRDFEVDIGKFTAKHFPSLVSYPTMEDGMRIWKQFELPKLDPEEMILPETASQNLDLNLGELYRKYYSEPRLFNETELTVAIGRTLKPIDVDERKEKNENSYESSGQFEQWTQAYRVSSQVTKIMDMGTSFAITSSIPGSATVSSSIDPIESVAMGIDGGLSLLDRKLTFDWEVAYSDYDENTNDNANKHKHDKAWLSKTQYRPTNELTFTYEQKTIGKNFEVEGAYQTEDKTTHSFDLQYRLKNPKTWYPKSLSLKYKPEKTNITGGGTDKKRYKTFQSVIDFKLPDDAKYSLDYKYYRDYDKCVCTSYRTRTFKHSFDWEFKPLKTTFKPTYTFERKDDQVFSATDEKKKELVLALENTLIENLRLKYSWERESKHYHGFTNKAYDQYTQSFESKHTVIPSMFDWTLKASRDFKDPSDTSETDNTAYSLQLNYTSKSQDNKVSLKYERKNNFYKPWSDTSAYRQEYLNCKVTHKF